MKWKRVLRIAVCLVLVCTLVVGISPIRAKAAYVPAVTEATIIGVLVYSLLYSSGMIMEPPGDIQALDDAAESFERYIYNNMTFGSEFPGDDDEDKRDKLWEELERTAVKVKDKLHSETWTPKDRLIYNLGTLGVVAACDFLWDCIEKGYFDTEVEVSAPTGFMYYGELLLPEIPHYDEDFPYVVVGHYADSVYYFTSPVPFKLYGSSGDYDLRESSSEQLKYYRGSLLSYNDGTNYWSSSLKSQTSSSSNIVYNFVPIWANHDLASSTDSSKILFEGSDPSASFVQEEVVEPIATVGSIVEGIQAGALKAADIPIPETVDFTSIFEGIETSGVGAISNNLANKATEISNGSLSIDDFRESITYTDSSGDDSEDPTEVPGATDGVEDPDDPGDGSEGNEQITDATLSNFPVLNFFARLGQLLQDIMNGNLLGIKNFFNPWFESIGQWFQDIRGDISGVRDDLSDIDSTLLDGFQDIIDANQQQEQVNQEIQQEQNDIIQEGFSNFGESISEALTNAFVPSDGFLESKVNDLRNEYSFANSIALTALDLRDFLVNLGSTPPVIRINLGASTGKYNYGGDMVLVDFSFYEPYKPQMDAILSAFLWLWFCWRVVLTLPGIISGASGVVGSFNPYHNSGSRGYIEVSSIPEYVTDAKGNATAPSHVPFVFHKSHQGSTAHYNEWVRNRNDQHFNDYHRKKGS